MNLAIIGNNDGPLYLLKALKREQEHPVLLGLQKPVEGGLMEAYREAMPDEQAIQVGFDEEQLIHLLAQAKADVVINCFSNIIFKSLLQHFRVLNVHLSPLPEYRGRHPLQWGLINGEPAFGITIHEMVRKIDAGPILWQAMVPVERGMSVKALRQKLLETLEANFSGFWQAFKEGEIAPRENPDNKATYFPPRSPEDSELLNWDDAEKTYRKVMGLRSTKHPAFVKYNGSIIRFDWAKITGEMRSKGAMVIEQFTADKMQVVCKDGKLLILHVKKDT